MHIIQFTAPHDLIPYFSESLEEYGTVSAEELIEDDPTWLLKVYTNEPLEALKPKILLLFSGMSIAASEPQLVEYEDKNWVEENQKSFPPIQTDKFYVYSEFSQPSGNLIDIKIDPGMAFGTGQHETTYLCLEALGWLKAENQQFHHILDLGCGSGILAIAAGKLWDASYITASDNDPVAVEVSEENAEINDIEISPIVSEGFKDISGEFDLILANILLNPLLEMAEDMSKNSKGVIVLSGFKSDQADLIMNKYTALGYKPLRIFVKNHWVAAVFSK